MALRDRISKAFGGGKTVVPTDIVAITEVAIEQEQMVGEPFSPGAPLRPYDGYSGVPRSRDYRTGVNISSRPRLNEQVSFSTLQGLVNNYDIAQMCIWHRIDSIRSMQWHLVPKKGYTGDVEAAIEIGMQALKRPDREFPFKTWLAKYLFDILAYDAGTLYKIRNNAGQAIGLRVLDGTTIAPLLDYYGNRPSSPAPAFVQFAQGIPWEWLTEDDIIYEPFRPQSNSMYGKAPLETLLLNANTDLRFQQFFLNHFTEGNLPEGFAGAPEGWTPAQIEEFQDSWDALLYGDDTQKHQIKWVPHGTTFEWSNDGKFDDTFSLFLMRKTAAMFHVTPADLGFTEDVNRASGETQADVQFRVGDLPLMEHVAEILSNFLQEDLYLPLDFQFDTGREVEDRLQTAQADKIYVEMGAISASEVREKVYGLDEPEGQPVPRFVMTTRSGPVPLSALLAVAGPTDPDSAAPMPGTELPHKPFAPIEGVTPQKAPDQPPLAVQRYPEDNLESVAAEAVADNAPVLKDAAGISVLGDTVAEGSPMLAPPKERMHHQDGKFVRTGGKHFEENHVDPEDSALGDAVAKAAEDRAFRSFVKARVKSGRWRDFSFNHETPREARERNRLGHAEVAKCCEEVIAAGLCVRAADTGRVLMLQRAYDLMDPASGKWEFPGGHIEDGEDALMAAIREWYEETGSDLPLDVKFVNQWTSGVYQGVIVEVPSESSININPDVKFIPNPDDPDGDLVETCAWWDLYMLKNNPAVRDELAADADLVLSMLGMPVDTVIEKKFSEVVKSTWAEHSMHKVEQPLTDFHAPKIQKGIEQMVTKEQIRSLVERYLREQ